MKKSPQKIIKTWLEYLKFGFDFFICRKEKPYILGLVINDKCNLHCKHCRVGNLGRPDMSMQQVRQHLVDFYLRGARFLYLEGGEPYLWRDGNYRLNDVVNCAREIGYLRTYIYTNGTIKIDVEADFTWISIDGLDESYRIIRGVPMAKTLNNAKQFQGRGAIIFTINTINQDEIVEFLRLIQRELPGRKVLFFFHTPYYGKDELLLSPEAKQLAIHTIQQAKRDGLPVLNSIAGLNAISSGNYRHPTALVWVVDETGEFPCCRASSQPEVCEQCGYASCAEIILAQELKPGAILEILRMF